MISLSKEWSLTSRTMYGQEFIDELATFLKKYNIKTILECGCGDGHILNGLAKKGFICLGIDSNKEMIDLALKHPIASFKQINWLNIGNLNKCFDAIICRGNSLAAVVSWGKSHLNPLEAKKKIEESIRLFFSKLKKNGLLYLDTCSGKDAGNVEIKIRDINLKGKVEYNWDKMERRVYGKGEVLGEYFNNGCVSYILTTDELERILKKYSPKVFRINLINEKNYNIICAIKN